MKRLLPSLLLTASLLSAQSYEFNIYSVNAYNQTIPALSLAITPDQNDRFTLILSYVSTLLNLEQKVEEYTIEDGYTNLQMSLNFKF